MDLVTVDRLLTTTRSVRRRLDLTRPVEPELIQRCLEIAIQAPCGSGVPKYHFVVVTDPIKRAGVAELYRAVFTKYRQSRASQDADPAMVASATYLAEHLHEVPVHVIPCVAGRFETEGAAVQGSRYGDIVSATWSFMLALRARGVGAAWTTLHLYREREAAALLGIPDDVTQAALLPVAYFTGTDFKVARRVPARERTYWDGWGRTR
jgi:nitroreductase